MLEKIFSDHTALFRSLAETWLSSGASGFSILLPNKHILANYPSHIAPKRPDITCPIIWQGQELGTLGVVGFQGRGAEKRLQQDTLWIASLCTLDSESEHMAQMLLEGQERMLAVYEFSNIYHKNSDPNLFLRDFVRFCLPLINAEIGFALLVSAGDVLQVVAEPTQAYHTKFYQRLLHYAQNAKGSVLLPGSELPFELPENLTSLFFMPFTLGEHYIGGFGFCNHPQGLFTSNNVQLLQSLGNQASAQLEILLEHQRVVDKTNVQSEGEIAYRIQKYINVSALPQIPELDIASQLTRPDGTGVSSDGHYQWLQANTSSDLLVAFGALTGSTVTSALQLNVLLASLRNKIKYLRTPSPQLVVQRILEDVQSELQLNQIDASLFFASIQVSKQQIIYSNVGLNLCWHITPQQAPRQLNNANSLRTLAPTRVSEQRLHWLKGDYLVLASPGYNYPKWETLDFNHWLRSNIQANASETCEALVMDFNHETDRQFAQGDRLLSVVRCRV